MHIPNPTQLETLTILNDIFWNLPPTKLSTNTNLPIPAFVCEAILLFYFNYIQDLIY